MFSSPAQKESNGEGTTTASAKQGQGPAALMQVSPGVTGVTDRESLSPCQGTPPGALPHQPGNALKIKNATY